MASGMDPSTATGLDTDCGQACCGYNRDNFGLRGHQGECAVFGDPNFGAVDLDWENRIIQLSILNGDGSGVAKGADGKLLTMAVDMDTCEPM